MVWKEKGLVSVQQLGSLSFSLSLWTMDGVFWRSGASEGGQLYLQTQTHVPREKKERRKTWMDIIDDEPLATTTMLVALSR